MKDVIPIIFLLVFFTVAIPLALIIMLIELVMGQGYITKR